MAEKLNLTISFDHMIPLEIVKSDQLSKGIILGLHGYAQMATNLVKHLELLAGEELDYCSLQAPHIFTTPNNTYVSTWMNRLNRDQHVNYQIQYFNDLNRQLNQNEYNDVTKIGFGFSQGASSLYRMVFLSQLEIKLAIMYAGDIPPEIKELGQNKIDLIKTKFILIHGQKDNVMSKDKIREDYEWLVSRNFKVEVIEYEGNHNIEPKVLGSISSHIKKVLC